MSRLIVFDKGGLPAGELNANCDRGWAISDGGSTTIELSAAEAEHNWLQLGNLVYVAHAELPPWCGMIDTPWGAGSPCKIAIYDIQYLLSRRSPYVPEEVTASIPEVVKRYVALANQIGDTTISPGNVDSNSAVIIWPVDTRNIWDQLKSLAASTGKMIQLRTVLTAGRTLVNYLDMQSSIGAFTGIELYDGEDGNVTIESMAITGEFWNAVEGVTDGATQGSKVYSSIHRDSVSISTYRARNHVIQVNRNNSGELEDEAAISLASSRVPNISAKINIHDKEGIFKQLRLGNIFKLRATQCILPGGRRGWTGFVRITAMSYNEKTNQVSINLEGDYE